MEQRKDKNIGALWEKTADSGRKYMTGNIEINGEEISVVLFPNRKQNDRQPDWRILISDYQKDKPQREQKRERIEEEYEHDEYGEVPF